MHILHCFAFYPASLPRPHACPGFFFVDTCSDQMLGPGRSMMMDACDDSNVDLWNCIFALFLNFGWILAATIGMINVERIAPSNDDSPSIIRRTQVLLAIGTVIAILCVFGACTYRLRPSPRALHSNDDAADNLTAVKVPPVQSALQSRPLIATCVLQFTGYTVSVSVHWCLPPSIFSCTLFPVQA